jgi:SsrA-binding protein
MEKTVVTNRKAHRDYEIIYTIEAGIELKGSEVKSLRQGRANLNDSFARVEGGEVYLYNFHISQYQYSSDRKYDPTRPRRLLLHKNQIARLAGDAQRKGYTLIPLRVYSKDNKWAKVELALAKGKKLYDKREDLKKKAIEREIKQELKGFR